MDNSVSESLLQAMATMFSDAPQTVIECNVVSCDDPILGSYTVEYQMNKFTAFASANLETPFSAGSGVYVIVPNGDFTKTKYILGASAPGKAAAAISDNVYDADTFVNISDNMLDPSSTYALQSYKTTQVEGSREEINISLATAFTSSIVEHFLNDGKRIFHLDFAVKTDLPAEQRNKEDAKYGIIVTFNGENNTVKSWELSTIDMEGSPMAYDVWTKGRLKFEVPEDFVFDSSQNIGIKIYKQDFNVKEDPVDDDIFFTNVELYAVKYLSESEMGGYYLNINAASSPYFVGSSTSKLLTASLRANGQRVNSNDIDYYWFEEDLSVNSNSEYYVANAGLGWKCVNDENHQEGSQVHNYIPTDSYTVLKTKVKGSKQYKCLTVYNNNLVSNTITIVNDDPSAFSFVIDSDAGPAFPQDKGIVKLTARFFYNGVSTVAANINNIDFNWAFFGSDGKWDSNFPHSTPSAKRQVGDYIEQDILIDSNNIVQMLTAKVNAVVTTAFGDFIVGNQLGTTRLNLVIKADDAEISLYNLIMTDSEKVYKYSSSGYSPMVTQYEGAVASRVDTIKPISYRIYHQDGTEFNQSEYNACITTWRVPVNSLIELDNPPQPQDEYYIITSSGKADLNYNIADFYESSKSDDTIYLSIDFNGYEIKGVAHIQTIKNGELGTNGTSCICTLKARVGGQDEPSFVYQEKDANGKIHSLKLIAFNNAWYVNKADGKFYDRTGIELKLIPHAQRGNDTLTKDTDYTVSYSMYSNGLTNIVSVNSSTGILTLGDVSSVTEASLKNNIIKAVVTIDGWGVPTFYPIEIIRINTNAPGVSFYEEDIPLLLGGFNSVQYRSSGYEPLMQPDSNIFEYNDDYLAVAPTWSTENRFDIESNGDQCTVTPKEARESANLYYYVSASGSLNASPAGITGTITHYKPIIVYNDNYGNETVNGWDGISLAIDDNNATIMGVMSGWGEKDNQNKFSGVLLGSVKQGNDIQRGIFAYNKSDQTFRLDADDGSLHIGKSGKGQIEILPGTDSAKIIGGNYVDAQGTGTGMEIDLAAPSIKWGNRKFRVDPDGTLHATDGVFAGEITATSGEITGDLAVTGSFIMSDDPDNPEEYYVTIENGEIVLYTVCDEEDNGATYNSEKDFWWNKKTELNKRGLHVENNYFNETLDASTSNNTTEPGYVGMSGVFKNDWTKETTYQPSGSYPSGYHKGMVDINSDGIKLSHYLSNGSTFNQNNRIYDFRLGHFTETADVDQIIGKIEQYWQGDVSPKCPEEMLLLMQDPNVESDKFLMGANDQIIMVGDNNTSKMSPKQFRVRNCFDPNVTSFLQSNRIGINDYFYKSSPYRINTKPVYTLVRQEDDDIVPGETNLEDGCFIVVYDGPARDKEVITLTIYGGMDDTITIKDTEGTTITTLTFATDTSVGVLETQDLDKFSTYRFRSAVYNFTMEHTIAKANDEVEVIPADVKWIRVADFPVKTAADYSSASYIVGKVGYEYDGHIYAVGDVDWVHNTDSPVVKIYTFDASAWSLLDSISTPYYGFRNYVYYPSINFTKHNGKLWMFIWQAYGYGTGGQRLYYVLNNGTWERKNSDISGNGFPDGVWYAFSYNNLLYMFSQRDRGSGDQIWYMTTYNETTDTLSSKKQLPIDNFGSVSVILYNNEIHVFYAVDYYNNANHIVIDPITASTVKDLGRLPFRYNFEMRYHNSHARAIVYKNKLLVFGQDNVIYEYNNSSNTWSTFDNSPYNSDNADASPVIYNNQLFVIGNNYTSQSGVQTLEWCYKYRDSEPPEPVVENYSIEGLLNTETAWDSYCTYGYHIDGDSRLFCAVKVYGLFYASRRDSAYIQIYLYYKGTDTPSIKCIDNTGAEFSVSGSHGATSDPNIFRILDSGYVWTNQNGRSATMADIISNAPILEGNNLSDSERDALAINYLNGLT